jgi:DNA-binding PadR family transcriptional regulator
VSVRSSLLAILTIGPAYGFQLHGELQSRTAGRRTVNVGQIYGTLDRLVRQGAIESAGTTDDALPLYRLTTAGRDEAVSWLASTQSVSGEEWNDLVNRVLIASSLPATDVLAVVAANRARWEETDTVRGDGDDSQLTGQERLAAQAHRALASAALAWLDEAEAQLGADSAAFTRDFNAERPRRGRRPVVAPAA